MDVAWFAERDIDLLIAEELRVNPAFARWWLDALRLDADLSVPATRTRVSVVDENGEVDVEALFSVRNGIFALLVENKVNAEFQPDQMERYVRRGAAGLASGLWNGFAIVVFGPARRIEALRGRWPDVHVLSFEAAANALRTTHQDIRAIYRADFLERAGSGKSPLVASIEPHVVAFWTNVDRLLEQEFPDFFGERRVFPRTTYINPKTPDMPAYLRLDLKEHMGQVELTFKPIHLDRLRAIADPLIAKDMAVVRNGKSAAVRLVVEPFLVGDAWLVAEARVRAAFTAAKQLVDFWRAHRPALERAAPSALANALQQDPF